MCIRCDATGTEAGAPPRSLEGSDKPARPPALQVGSSRVRVNRVIFVGTIETVVAASCESHNYRGQHWRAGGLAGLLKAGGRRPFRALC